MREKSGRTNQLFFLLRRNTFFLQGSNKASKSIYRSIGRYIGGRGANSEKGELKAEIRSVRNTMSEGIGISQPGTKITFFFLP